MSDLLKQQCEPISAQSEALSRTDVTGYMDKFEDWTVIDSGGELHLRREFKFPDFREAALFAYYVGQEADEQNHHPVIAVEYGKAVVTWWTHALNGLHRNDFIMAARTDDIYSRWEIIIGDWDAVSEASDESFPASDPPGF